MKVCTKCDRSLPLGEFYRDRNSGDGRQRHCRKCQKRHARKCYANDPEAARQRLKEYYAANREAIRQRQRAQRAANLEAWRRYQRAYRAANLEARAGHEARRRARKAKNWTDPRPEDIARRQALYDIAAWLRGCGDDVAVDHIVPVALGGPDTYSNLRILTRSENLAKGARPPTAGELEAVTLMVQSCG